jgi:hypothetical protein
MVGREQSPVRTQLAALFSGLLPILCPDFSGRAVVLNNS